MRICWLWEWEGEKLAVPKSGDKEKDKEDNPFLDAPPSAPDDWTRGAMGFLVTATTHLSKQARQRIPAYGVGIEIEVDIDRGMDSGMAAVARWTSEADSRQKELKKKVEKWVEVMSPFLWQAFYLNYPFPSCIEMAIISLPYPSLTYPPSRHLSRPPR